MQSQPHTLLRDWLKLPPGPWPPDYYTLVGLPQGEGAAIDIEMRVLERMERLRRYQIKHPDLVIDAMNQLAQALNTLTDTAARATYDVQTLGRQAAPPAAVPPERPAPASVFELATPTLPVASPPATSAPASVVSIVPPPAVVAPAASILPDEPLELVELPAPSEPVLEALPAEPPPIQTGESATYTALPADPPDPLPPQLVQLLVVPPPIHGQHFQRLRASLPEAQLRAQFKELRRVKQVFHRWEAIAPYLGEADRRLIRRSDALLLARQLTHLRNELADRPATFADTGRPGALVAALTRQPFNLTTFRGLLPSQRQALAQDWQAGWRELTQMQRRIQAKVRELRPVSGGWPRLARRLGRGLTRQLDLLWLALAGLALGVACLRAFR